MGRGGGTRSVLFVCGGVQSDEMGGGGAAGGVPNPAGGRLTNPGPPSRSPQN